MQSSIVQAQNTPLTSYDNEINLQQQQQQTKTLLSKFRKSISITGKLSLVGQPQKTAKSGLNDLNHESQELILRTVEKIKTEDCQYVIDVLDETRNTLRSSYEEFKREQDECRKQLEEISRLRLAKTKGHENEMPLKILTRRKAKIDGESDIHSIHSDTSVNSKYQAHFETVVPSGENDVQHPTDKAAVLKYIRRRERQKRAEETRKSFQLSDDALEKETAEIIQKMEVADTKLEHERQRQHELIRTRLNEKKTKVNDLIQANQIIEKANEADLIRQQVENTQREKIEVLVSAAREKRQSINMIHVKSSIKENDDTTLNNDQIKTTKKSVQLLNGDDNDKHRNTQTTISAYDNQNIKDKIPSVHI